MHVIRSSDQRAMPWKNGGGVTYEVAIFPPAAASFEDFDWRISMARVDSDGPFSLFAGIDRSLALMQGDGLVLTRDGAEVEIGAATPVVSFAGEWRVTARLAHGPITDLNVMTRRGAWRHRLAPEAIADRRTVVGASDTTLLIVRGGAVAIESPLPTDRLSHRDVLVMSEGEQASLHAQATPADLFRIELWRIT